MKKIDKTEELEFVKQIRAIRRKRILIKSPPETPLNVKLPLEALPQDILIRILCCVDHDDLKRLVQVSKSIKEASLIAKRVHFAFNTPSKRGANFMRCCSDLEFGSLDDEAPNAPKQERNSYRSRIDEKKLKEISVALFTSPKKKKQWRRRELFCAETKI